MLDDRFGRVVRWKGSLIWELEELARCMLNAEVVEPEGFAGVIPSADLMLCDGCAAFSKTEGREGRRTLSDRMMWWR